MSGRRMHDEEVETDAALVRRLLASQFPRWADLPIEPVSSFGTDNAIYRLGADMAVRLPRIHWAVGDAEKEHRWLPVLAPHLPLDVPVPLALGRPEHGYPWHWSVVPWLPGENATAERLRDGIEAATDLAGFVRALQAIDSTDGPPPGGRGGPLAPRDADVRRCIAELGDRIDPRQVTEAWEEALAAPVWDGPPVWIHGDLTDGNLLATDGRLSGVIDFGGLAVGDPASELHVAWGLFAGESRLVFRDALAPDDATWARARGWALSIALLALPYYLETNPDIVERSWRTLAEVLADR